MPGTGNYPTPYNPSSNVASQYVTTVLFGLYGTELMMFRLLLVNHWHILVIIILVIITQQLLLWVGL